MDLRIVALFVIGLPIGWLSGSSATVAGEERALADSSLLLLDKVVGKERMSPSQARLRFHLLRAKGDSQAAKRLAEEFALDFEDMADMAAVKLADSLASGSLKQKEVLSTYRKFDRSPTVEPLATRATNKVTDVIVPIASLWQDFPEWLPGLQETIRERHGSLGTKEAAIALELLDPGSEEARRMLLWIGGDDAADKELKGDALARKYLAKMDAPDKYLAGNLEMQAELDKKRCRAALELHSGQTDRARASYEALVKQGCPGTTYFRLMRIYEQAGLKDKAEQALQDGLQARPGSACLLLRQAEDLRRAAKSDEAVAALQKCLKAYPEYPRAHLLLARIQAERGLAYDTIAACAAGLGYSRGWDIDALEQVNDALRTLNERGVKGTAGGK